MNIRCLAVPETAKKHFALSILSSKSVKYSFLHFIDEGQGGGMQSLRLVICGPQCE